MTTAPRALGCPGALAGDDEVTLNIAPETTVNQVGVQICDFLRNAPIRLRESQPIANAGGDWRSPAGGKANRGKS